MDSNLLSVVVVLSNLAGQIPTDAHHSIHIVVPDSDVTAVVEMWQCYCSVVVVFGSLMGLL